jgi:cytochrome c biogenesis protein CcmG, thiol:disulfide interchange protein DsbE
MMKLLQLLLLAGTLAFAGPKPGSPAPTFSLPKLFNSQGPVSLQSMQGKVVLVDFWASWCSPCRKTLPDLGRLRTRHPNLIILALSIDEDRAKALGFLKSNDSSLVFLHDAKREAAEKFDLGGMPSAFLIDRHGILRQRFDGYGATQMKNMEIEITKLLEEKS